MCEALLNASSTLLPLMYTTPPKLSAVPSVVHMKKRGSEPWSNLPKATEQQGELGNQTHVWAIPKSIRVFESLYQPIWFWLVWSRGCDFNHYFRPPYRGAHSIPWPGAQQTWPIRTVFHFPFWNFDHLLHSLNPVQPALDPRVNMSQLEVWR